MIKKYRNTELPKELSANWNIEEVLSCDESHMVCTIRNNTVNDTVAICKIYQDHCFSVSKYRKISKLAPKYLLLPNQVVSHAGSSYVLFSREDNLKQILYDTGLSLQQILLLGIDLTFAAMDLFNGKCYSIDINPSNIYRKADGKFCLGDLDMEKKDCPGTYEYLAPEEHKSTKLISKKHLFQKAPSTKLAHERSIQYSICRLLENILQINEELSSIEEVSKLLTKGTSARPEQRYADLAELSEELSVLLDKYSEMSFPIAKLTQRESTLFQQKTLPVSHTFSFPVGLSKVNLSAALLLMITGSIFVYSVNRFLPSHPADSIASQNSSSFELAVQPSSRIIRSESPVEGLADSISSGQAGLSSPDSISSDQAGLSSPDPTSSGQPGSAASDTAAPEPSGSSPSDTIDSVRELDIQRKGYYSIATVLQKKKEFTNCTCLYAGENHFSNLTDISGFSSLQELYLNENQLKDISALEQCPNLQILVLSYNHIEDIAALIKLQNLIYLDLSSNARFSDSSSLCQMKQLKTLNISGTNLNKKQVRQLSQKLPDCQIIS